MRLNNPHTGNEQTEKDSQSFCQVMIEQPAHQTQKRYDADHNAQAQHCEKPTINVLPGSGKPTLTQHLQCGEIELTDRGNQALIVAEDQSNGSATDAGNSVGRPHETTTKKVDKITAEVFPFALTNLCLLIMFSTRLRQRSVGFEIADRLSITAVILVIAIHLFLPSRQVDESSFIAVRKHQFASVVPQDDLLQNEWPGSGENNGIARLSEYDRAVSSVSLATARHAQDQSLMNCRHNHETIIELMRPNDMVNTTCFQPHSL